MADLDAEIAELVQSQSAPCKDGHAALQVPFESNRKLLLI